MDHQGTGLVAANRVEQSLASILRADQEFAVKTSFELYAGREQYVKKDSFMRIINECLISAYRLLMKFVERDFQGELHFNMVEFLRKKVSSRFNQIMLREFDALDSMRSGYLDFNKFRAWCLQGSKRFIVVEYSGVVVRVPFHLVFGRQRKY